MNKKSFLVILLAALVAFISAFFISNVIQNKNEKPNISDSEKIETNNDTIEKSIQDNALNDEETATNNETTVETQTATKAQQKTATKEIKKYIPKEEKVINSSNAESLQKTLEVSIEEETVDYGLYREEGTGNIIITRHFSSKSPTKYSFKGYGIIDKLVK